MSTDKPKRKDAATDKQKPPGKRGPQSKPPSFSHLTFDEMVDIALKTKPKKLKKKEEVQNSGETERVEE